MIEAFFEFRFVSHAIIAALLSSIVCGIVGTYIVTNRIVFLSGGITHASFGGLGIAWYLGLNPILGATIFSVLTALGIEFFAGRTQIRQDSVIGIWWSLGMAIGVIFIYLTPGYTPNLMSYLFGSILSIETFDLVLLGMLSVFVVLFFGLFYRPIQFISFDSEYVQTHGVSVALFRYILIAIVALTIVFSIKIAGIILIISLLTIPQAVANLLTHSYIQIMGYSILIAFIGSLTGLITSWYINIPSGAAIIFSLTLIFGIVKLAVHVFKQKKKQG